MTHRKPILPLQDALARRAEAERDALLAELASIVTEIRAVAEANAGAAPDEPAALAFLMATARANWAEARLRELRGREAQLRADLARQALAAGRLRGRHDAMRELLTKRERLAARQRARRAEF